jgi:hypothetical protein
MAGRTGPPRRKLGLRSLPGVKGMRHLRYLVGVVLAIVMAAAVFFAATWGYLKLLTRPGRLGAVPASGSLIHDHVFLEGVGVLLAVGLLAGLLIAVPRISPLASGLPGLALLAWTGLYLFSVRQGVQYIPLKTRAYGTGFEAMLSDGVLAVAGAAMIIPLFVPSRWRRAAASAVPAPPLAEASTATFPALQATQTMAADDFFSGAPPTRPQPRLETGSFDNPDAPGRSSQAPWGPADFS